MRPLVVLLGIVMGSAVSIALTLLMVGLVFLLLPEYGARIADESGALWWASLIAAVLAGIAVTSFYGELRLRRWRYAAHLALTVMLAFSLWIYWPNT